MCGKGNAAAERWQYKPAGRRKYRAIWGLINYGAVFPWWDLVFGTYRNSPRDGHERMRLGLDEVRGDAAQRPLWLLGSIVSDRLEPAAEDRTRASATSRCASPR